jgi:hypothetical protein
MSNHFSGAVQSPPEKSAGDARAAVRQVVALLQMVAHTHVAEMEGLFREAALHDQRLEELFFFDGIP